MTHLSDADRDLLIELREQPLLIAPNSQHPDVPALDDLMRRGLVMTTHSRQGGTIYGITWAGRKVLAGQG